MPPDAMALVRSAIWYRMLDAVIIGWWPSTPGLFSMRRRILLLRRFNWRWTLAFTRKPPGGRTVEGVKHLDCSSKSGGFRAFRPQSARGDAWLRTRQTCHISAKGALEQREEAVARRPQQPCSYAARPEAS